jgi:hypothetical protein
LQRNWRRGGDAVAQPWLIRLIIRVTGDTIALSEKGLLESERTMTRRRLFRSPALAIASLSLCLILAEANPLHAQGPYQPGGASQPGTSYQPGGVTQPGTAYQPGGVTQPGATYQPGAVPQPGATYQPGASYQPGAAYQPGIGGPYRPGSATTPPGAVYQPGGMTPPGAAYQPGGTTQPGAAYQPGVGTPYQPGVTPQPGTSPTGTR